MERINHRHDNIIKRWYKLCEPNKKDWSLQLISYTLYAVINALMAIFTAKTINCLYNGDYRGAFIWLGVEFLDIVLRNIFKHIEYHYYGKTFSQINKNLCSKIYDKVLAVNINEIKKFSAEKIINIAQGNTSYACEFPDYVAVMLSKLVQIIVSLVAIFTSSWWAGLIVLGLVTINYFAYNKIYKRLGNLLKKRFEAKDDMFKEYSKIINGKDVISELGAQADYKEKIFSHVEKYNKEYRKYYMTDSFKGQIYFVLWNVVVYAITAVLIFLISKHKFDLALYLVVVPYLTTCTTKFNDLYDKFGGIENMRVDVDRLNLILSLNNKELISFGNVNKLSEGYNLGFANVTYQDKENPDLKLTNASLTFKMNAINIIRGDRGSGKRVIFDILRRRIMPDEGVVILDNLNLYEYSPSTFKNHIDYCAQHPFFIKGTILENLQATKRDLSKLNQLIEQLGLQEVIQRLPNGLQTQVDEIEDEETRFWIGIIRAALSKCKVLMIYEYLNTDNPEFHKMFQNILKTCETDKRTLILFTHSCEHDQLADSIFEVNNGKVKKIKNELKNN